MFDRRGILWQIPRSGATTYLDSLGILGPRTLLVHGVQLAAEEREVLRKANVAWAHCPKSNAKLGNGIADLSMLGLEAARDCRLGPPRVGLGTDSVASNNNMDLFEEMRFAVLMQRGMRRNISALTAKEAVEMTTIGGAVSLGLDADIGTLQPGKIADLCVVRLGDLHSAPCYDPYSSLVFASRAPDVIRTIINGETKYDAEKTLVADRFPDSNITPAMNRMSNAAQKMREWRPAE
jgi:5-methylthioadenosine/S-adenosylhomocysteine deaminase